MPEKSVREMSAVERRSHSIEAKTFKLLVRTGILIGIVLLAVGLSLYTVSLSGQYINHASYISKAVYTSAEQDSDMAGLCNEVMEIYGGLTEEQRALTSSEEYRALFDSCLNCDDYEYLFNLLPKFATDEVSYIYIAMYDEENCRMIYVVDPSQDSDRLYPGEWEEVEESGMRKFLDWNGVGVLYDIDRTSKYGWLCTAGTPIRDDNGNLAGFILVDISVDNVWAGMRLYTMQIMLSLVAVILLLILIASRRLRRTVVEPINNIASCAEKYAQDKINGVHDTDHFSSLNIRTGDEIENLCLTMADMEHEMGDYIKNIQNITAEKERISTELDLAKRIQTSMLPHIFPAFPDRTEFDVYASMDPAKEVGGDFYDYFLVDEDHLYVVLADVSGKGVPAALMMMAVKIIIANYAKMGYSPAQVLQIANKAICDNNQEEMFVSVWLGVLEISTGKITAANAGHEYPAIRKGDGQFEMMKERHSLVVGAMHETTYREYEVALTPGSKIFLYTDGVPEASNSGNELFGEERMVAALNKDAAASPEQILANVEADVKEFVQGAEQFDDLTMLCLEYKG